MIVCLFVFTHRQSFPILHSLIPATAHSLSPVMASLRVAAAALFASSALASVLNVPRSVGEVVDTEALQAAVTKDALRKRAEELYEIAKASEAEYGHPTRAIGTAGKSTTTCRLCAAPLLWRLFNFGIAI